MIEKDVSIHIVINVLVPRAIFKKNVTLYSKTRRKCSGLARVVRLSGPLRHHYVSALCFRLGHQEFQLSGLIPARRHARAIVSLDPDIGTKLL
jgi:hypothetical protein